MEKLRRLYNSIDALFDRTSLSEKIHYIRKADSGNFPVTANNAFSLCLSIAAEYDRKACLMLIVSPDGSIQPDGCSPKWEFFFDLPQRRAKMAIVWYLPWSEDADQFESAQIDITVDPFPPPDSVHRRLVSQGKLLRKQLVGMWHREHHRKPPLPHRFRDSDVVMSELREQGLDIAQMEVTLRAECKVGENPLWSADTRHKSFHVQFT